MTDIVAEIMKIEHFKELTPIQKEVLQINDKKRDIIGISSTGSGKTHAFFLPIFQKVDPDKNEVQAVISTPTRELAYQLYERAKKLGDYFHIRIQLVTGGMEKKVLAHQPQIVIGTPGRMKDVFINDQTLRLDTAQIMVIDEADMTLEFGFLEDIDNILSKMDKKIQIMVFSATIPDALKPFLKKYLYDPYLIQIDAKADFQSNVTHYLVPCKHKSYEEKIVDVLKCIQPYVCLIFTNTNDEATSMAEFLRNKGYDLVEIHGSMESRERKKAIKMIQSQKKSYIVATDIAARGIDLDGVTHVISCGFPKDLKYYIHRAGRTGRVQRDGICIALYQEKDSHAIESLMKQGIHFEHRDCRSGQWQILKPWHEKAKKKPNDAYEEEIERIVHAKKKKVKPGYKKKQKQEIERLKKKRKRAIIQKDIQRQKKERARARQRAKGHS